MIKVVGAQPSGGTKGDGSRPATASAGARNSRGLSRLVHGSVSGWLAGVAATRGVKSRLHAGAFGGECRTVGRENSQRRRRNVHVGCRGRVGRIERFSRHRNGGILHGRNDNGAGRGDRFGGRPFFQRQGSGEIGKRKRVGAGHKIGHRDQHRFKHGDGLGNRWNYSLNKGRSGPVRGFSDGRCNGRNCARWNRSVHHRHRGDQVVRHSRNLAGHWLQQSCRLGGHRRGGRRRSGSRCLRFRWNSSGNLACHRGNGQRYGVGDTAQEGRSLRKGIGRRSRG